jgi:hypothetical protein
MCTDCRIDSAYTLGQIGLHIRSPGEVEEASATEESIPEGWQHVEAVHCPCSLGREGWKRRNRGWKSRNQDNRVNYRLLALEDSFPGL